LKPKFYNLLGTNLNKKFIRHLKQN